MRQRDYVEIVGAVVGIVLFTLVVSATARSLRWPLSVAMFVPGGVSGFILNELMRRIRRRRTR